MLAWIAVWGAAAPAGAVDTIVAPRAREVWRVVEVEGFVLLGDVSGATLERLAADILVMRESMEQATGLTLRSPLPTRVFAFRTAAGFAPFRDALLGAPDRAVAGVFAARDHGNYVLLNLAESWRGNQVLYHELAHFFLHNTLPDLPLWLDEGLAEFTSTFSRTRRGAEIGHPHQLHLQLLFEEPLIPLETLFEVTHDSPWYVDPLRSPRFYAQAWALTHYLLLGDPDGTRGLGRFLTLSAQGISAVEAFEQGFQVTFRDMEEALRGYLRRGVSGSVRVPVTGPVLPAVPPARALTRAELLVSLADLLSRCDPRYGSDAERLLESALATSPDYPPALALRGVLRLRRADAGGLEDLERAAAFPGPWAGPALLLGEHLLKDLFARYSGGNAPRPLVERVRELFRRALALGAPEALALAGLGMASLFEDADPSRESLDALARAWELLPSRPMIGFNLAILLARAGRPDHAQDLLDGPLARFRDPSAAERVRDALVVAQLQEIQEVLAGGGLEEAADRLERLQSRDLSPAARRQVATTLEFVAREQATREGWRRYHHALEYLNAGAYDMGALLLEQILAQEQDPALLEAAREILAGLRASPPVREP